MLNERFFMVLTGLDHIFGQYYRTGIGMAYFGTRKAEVLNRFIMKITANDILQTFP